MKTLNRINPIRDYLKHSALAVAAGAAPASAAPPVTTNLVLALDASALTGLSDGTQVNTWTDTSASANNAIATGSAATYQTGALNGQPVVRFNADANASFNFTEITTIRTVFWVVKNTTPGMHFLLGDSDAYDFHAGEVGEIWHSNWTSDYIKNGTTKLMGTVVNGTATVLPSSSYSLVSLVTTGNVRANRLTLDRTYGRSWASDMAEILIYDKALTTEEEALVGGYLTAKYGLTTAYPPLELAVKLTSPANAVALPTGTSVMATAYVADPGAFTHTVTFHTTPISPSGSTVDTVSTDTSSPFSVNLGALAAGTYEIYATVLNNDTPAGTATSATHTFTVAPAVPTTTTLASPATPSTYGQNVTFTATVSPPPTGGTVQFFDGGSPLGSPATVNTTTGEATYSSTALGVGTHGITAQYNGYQIYETSTTAASISQVVDQAPLTVTALNMFRTVNTPNPVQFPYQITGYQNGQNLATSGVTGTPVLTTDATLSSPVGPYVINCALGTLLASNYSFTLENGTLTVTDLACQLGVLNLSANGGINPATGVPWALGDTYRLIFITSAHTVCDSTDIATYNSFVQGLAAASTSYPKLGSVTWKVVGSTASVAARDNTSTNPSVNGVGEPIVRMDGLFVIANNYADLWDGAINSTHVPGQNYLAVAFDENGVERIEERVRTGTLNNGTAGGVLGGPGNVGTGRNYAPNFYGGYGGWTQDWSDAAASPGPVYAMSALLTIQSTNLGNTFTSWADANNATGQTPDQDHDNDGVENGIEYFMGETGSSFTAMPGLDGTNTVTWPMDPAYNGTYEVQTSPDLGTWTNVDLRPTPAGGNLSYTLTSGLGKNFVRLLVTPAP